MTWLWRLLRGVYLWYRYYRHDDYLDRWNSRHRDPTDRSYYP